MKDKILYLIIGLLMGAILTTGVFILMNKNNVGDNNNNGQFFNNGNGPILTGEPPTQEQLDSMIRTEMEDGSVRYQSPDGGMIIQRKEVSPEGIEGQ